jgi:WD40 repeat protein
VKLAGAFLAVIPLAFGGMEKVWEVRIGRGGQITTLAFSPDGKQLAVAAGARSRTRGGQAPTQVLLLNPENPGDQSKRFDVAPCASPLTWAPSGGALLVCDTIVKIADGSSCDSHPPDLRDVNGGLSPAVWIDPRHLLQLSALFDTDCARSGSWAPVSKGTPGKWGIADTAPDRGWALIWRRVGVRPNESDAYSVEDIRSRELIGKPVSLTAQFLPKAIFVPGERAWCGWTERRPRCWSVESGKEIHLSSALGGLEFKSAAALSPRAIVEHWGISHGFLSDLFPATLKRRAVYDFSSQAIVASWEIVPHTLDLTQEPDSCAISPDGQFVAESGDGVVRLYRLTP